MPKERQLTAARTVKLFRNGRNQAVRIPREFELPGDQAFMRKDGDRLVIEPARDLSLVDWLATLEPLGEEFSPIEDLPPEPVDL
jgi:antitoxin VapB